MLTLGDERANEQPGLTSIHTVFVLEHNRLVRKLAKVVLYRTGRAFSTEAVEHYLYTADPPVLERIYQVTE